MLSKHKPSSVAVQHCYRGNWTWGQPAYITLQWKKENMTNEHLPMHTHFVKMTSTTLQSFLLTQGIPHNTSQESYHIIIEVFQPRCPRAWICQVKPLSASNTQYNTFWDNSWVSLPIRKKPSVMAFTWSVHSWHTRQIWVHTSQSQKVFFSGFPEISYELLVYTFNLLTNTQPGEDRAPKVHQEAWHPIKR